MEKQICEIAEIICDNMVHGLCDTDGSIGNHNCEYKCRAKDLYNAGYRKKKEGEWIKYPHNPGIYCSLCKHKRRYRYIHDAYCPNCGAKMKGE